MGSTRYLEWQPKDYICGNGEKSNCAQTIKELHSDAKQLEDELERWKREVSHIRENCFYQLNFYTMRQLLLLRRELSTVARKGMDAMEQILPHDYSQVYALLSAINPQVGPNDIWEIVNSCLDALSPVVGILETAPAHCRSVSGKRAASNESDDKYDCSLTTGYTPSSSADLSSPADEIKTHLSLNQLGQVLLSLHKKAALKPAYNVPHHIKLGQPNLIVVSEGDVIPTVLDFYRQNHSTPLPTASEVLICSGETTAEEVILWWRRAIFAKHLHCLVHAERLEYAVSMEIKDEIHRLHGVIEKYPACKDFALVVLCSSGHEQGAWIVSFLEEYRRIRNRGDFVKVREYLNEKFSGIKPKPLPRKARQRRPKPKSRNFVWEPAAKKDSSGSCVRLVTSSRSGMGKSLYTKRLAEEVASLEVNQGHASQHPAAQFVCTVPIQGNAVNTTEVMGMFMDLAPVPGTCTSRLFHIDVARSVQSGLDTFLFNLLVLGSVSDCIGRIWQRESHDLYIVEVTSDEDTCAFLRYETGVMPEFPAAPSTSKRTRPTVNQQLPVFSLLPAHVCGSPTEAYQALTSLPEVDNTVLSHPTFDHSQLMSEAYQCVFGYLSRYKEEMPLDKYNYNPAQSVNNPRYCLQLLLTHCGVMDPSWRVLQHFVYFLKSQLDDCEHSVYCKQKHIGDAVPGFKQFVVVFLLQMSKDFSTPSTDIQAGAQTTGEERLQLFLRRRWEQCPHPYLFFNSDRVSLTFVGFNVDSDGNLLDQNGTMLVAEFMSRRLVKDLQHQGVNLQEDFNLWDREKRLERLCRVLGQECVREVDESYELTLDNVKKIMAIQMRFRCDIPVVVMGETGCGKTRLIRFMCQLQAGSEDINNMLIMKIHGGIKEEHIVKMVERAERLADKNSRRQPPIDTVLFFDEANTSSALGMIKEVMCDRRINGRVIARNTRLKFIAACNPYRRHTTEMISRLEEAGLGYHVRSTETEDKLGRIPLRQLVYRVHPLPG